MIGDALEELEAVGAGGVGEEPRPEGDGDLRRGPPPLLLPLELGGVGGMSLPFPLLEAPLTPPPVALPPFAALLLDSETEMLWRRTRGLSERLLPTLFAEAVRMIPGRREASRPASMPARAGDGARDPSCPCLPAITWWRNGWRGHSVKLSSSNQPNNNGAAADVALAQPWRRWGVRCLTLEVAVRGKVVHGELAT